MKTKISFAGFNIFAAWLACVALACGCGHMNVYLSRKPGPRTDVVGSWFGFEKGFAHAYLLDLRSGGRGALARHYYGSGARVTVYDIADWHAEGESLELTFGPQGEMEVNSSASIGAGYIELRIWGEGWSHQATLNRCSVVKREMEVLGAALAGARARAPGDEQKAAH